VGAVVVSELFVIGITGLADRLIGRRLRSRRTAFAFYRVATGALGGLIGTGILALSTAQIAFILPSLLLGPLAGALLNLPLGNRLESSLAHRAGTGLVVTRWLGRAIRGVIGMTLVGLIAGAIWGSLSVPRFATGILPGASRTVLVATLSYAAAGSVALAAMVCALAALALIASGNAVQGLLRRALAPDAHDSWRAVRWLLGAILGAAGSWLAQGRFIAAAPVWPFALAGVGLGLYVNGGRGME
jgi:hypothetical protein